MTVAQDVNGSDHLHKPLAAMNGMEIKMHDVLSSADATALKPKMLPPDGGLRLQSGPGRDLIFKVTGEDTGGQLDYFIVQVAPHGGPPLHVHHIQEETIHVLKGRFKVRCGEQTFILEEGGFAYLPAKVPHAFLNLTGDPAELIVVYVPGGGHKFYEELGPVSRAEKPDRKAIADVFTRHGMTLLGAPLSPD